MHAHILCIFLFYCLARWYPHKIVGITIFFEGVFPLHSIVEGSPMLMIGSILKSNGITWHSVKKVQWFLADFTTQEESNLIIYELAYQEFSSKSFRVIYHNRTACIYEITSAINFSVDCSRHNWIKGTTTKCLC